jgi:hypothetical protein
MIPVNSEHARLGPSNPRWVFCPGSIREEAVYPDISGEAAIDGTGSHLLLELCLNNNARAEQYLGATIGENHRDKPNGWHVAQDRVERVQMCLDYVTARVKILEQEYPGSRIVVSAEARANPGEVFGRDDWWGTCDITIKVINSHQRCMFMEVIDYKDGRIYVQAKNNTQTLNYLFGQLADYIVVDGMFKPERVNAESKMTIVQPKTSPVVRSDEITSDALVEEAKVLFEAAVKTDDPNAPLIADGKAGKGYCRWCKHKQNCEALKAQESKEIQTMSTELNTIGSIDVFSGGLPTLENIEGIPAADLAKLCDAKPVIDALFKKALDEIERRVVADPLSVPGYAMVAGNDSYVWAQNEDETVKALRGRRLKMAEIKPPKLISPAQVAKLSNLTADQKKKIANDLVTNIASKTKSLKRVGVDAVKNKISTGEMFDSVTVENAVLDFMAPSTIDFMAPPEEAKPEPELSFL